MVSWVSWRINDKSGLSSVIKLEMRKYLVERSPILSAERNQPKSTETSIWLNDDVLASSEEVQLLWEDEEEDKPEECR